MALELEDLRVLKRSEDLADQIWQLTTRLSAFERRTVGEQLARSADSIGANIAECHGRYHFREKIRFLYYARGSLSETKYWLRRARARNLITQPESDLLSKSIERIGKEINQLISGIRRQMK